MNNLLPKLSLVLVAGLALAGCSGIGASSSQDISGKVVTAGDPEGDDGCRPYDPFFQYFQGAEVVLRDSTGQILGVSTIAFREDSPRLGTLEGDQCAFHFEIKDAAVEDSFYTIDFRLGQGQSGGQKSATVSLEQLTGDLVLNY